MKSLRYEIKLLEPLQLKSDGGDLNTAKSGGYISGSIIRGAIIGAWIKQSKEKFSPNDPNMRRLFFSDDTCFLNAYPVGAEELRYLPVPLSFKTNKDDDNDSSSDRTAYDLAVAKRSKEITLKSLPAEFFARVSDQERISMISSDRMLSVHTARAKTKGSPRKDDGAVFHQESLCEGQVFQGLIVANDDKDLEQIKTILIQITSIGSSKGGGYGRVEITVNKMKIEEVSFDIEAKSCDAESNGLLLLTFTSQATLRNNDGTTVCSKEQLQRFFLEQLGEPLTISNAFINIELTGGFNRKWCLPLPKEYSLSAGSVVVISNCSASIKAKLQALVLTGLGERKNEGFGRFCINLHGDSETYTYGSADKQGIYIKSEKVVIDKMSPAYSTAQLIVNRIARAKIESLLLEYVNKKGIEPSSSDASKSQINRLRNVLEDLISRRASGSESANKLKKYLESIKERQTSRTQLEKVKIEHTDLIAWLDAKCKSLDTGKPDAEWDQMIKSKVEYCVDIGGLKPVLSDELKHEYNLKLVHAVLLKLAK